MEQFIFTLIFLILISCEKDEIIYNDYNVVEANHSADEKEIVRRVNEYRISRGYDILFTDQKSQQMAEEHNYYMIKNDTIGHVEFPKRVIILMNLGATKVGENIAYGYKTVEAAVNSWIKNESHQRLMTKDFTHIGVSRKNKHITAIFIKVNY